MEDKLYIGIDVGAKGFISMQFKGSWRHFSIADNDLHDLNKIIKETRKEYENIACVIEDVHAIFGSSAKATFQFGVNKGWLEALLVANDIPYTFVQPKEWQREMWGNSDMVISYKKVVIKGKETTKKEVNTKATSINCAKRLFPMIDFRKSERAKNIDDNKVDSVLMSEFARRMNL